MVGTFREEIEPAHVWREAGNYAIMFEAEIALLRVCGVYHGESGVVRARNKLDLPGRAVEPCLVERRVCGPGLVIFQAQRCQFTRGRHER